MIHHPPTAAGGDTGFVVVAPAREPSDPASHSLHQAPPPRPPSSKPHSSFTIRARGSGSAGGVGGGTTGGSSISSGSSSPHALHSTTAATAATFANSMGDWEELKRKVRGIESKLEVRCERGEWARSPEPRVDVVFGDRTGLYVVVEELERERGCGSNGL